MRQVINKNLEVIKKYYQNKLIKTTNNEIKPLQKELREWIDDSFQGNKQIWTLPDLTRIERLDNFCRSIKKKIK